MNISHAMLAVLLMTTQAAAEPTLYLNSGSSPQPVTPLGSANQQAMQDGVNRLFNGTPPANFRAIDANCQANARAAANNRQLADARQRVADQSSARADEAKHGADDARARFDELATRAVSGSRIYGPSEIRELASKPTENVPWVPIGHENADEFFAIEKVVNDVARNLAVDTPRISSAYRSATEGAHPSRRHAFAALDLATTDLRFAAALSKELGDDYFVQIEIPGIPTGDQQMVYPFSAGHPLKPFSQARRADGNHTHVHLID